ncbi:MAG: hypothetical protein J7L73_05205, partial [Anaerolineales bacterium]|nr:hypothetical protein [Anaerolineales bacterium]
VEERIRREIKAAKEQVLSGGAIYLPKGHYKKGQKLVFPALGWKKAKVISVREGMNPDVGKFKVIKVQFDGSETKEFASGVEEHQLNFESNQTEGNVPETNTIINIHGEYLLNKLEEGLREEDDFVRIAGRWFPRALLVNVNAGHLNLAEAVLDMANGGPLSTSALIKEIELGADENQKLIEFSLDLALEEDERFDEVGPAGEVQWFLHRLEPEEVRKTPKFLRYTPIEYDQRVLSDEMIALEKELDDELSPNLERGPQINEITIRLIYPHIRSGTIPLTPRIKPFFPTAYESPRIRFIFVDGNTGEKFPGWVVRDRGYVFGLAEWYKERGLMPGSLIHIINGEKAGEVIIQVNSQRSSKDWLRTVLVGADGGMVFALLKQIITAVYDDSLAIAVPDPDAIDEVWERMNKPNVAFERIVVDIIRELTKLNPQSHVHITELYAAMNLVRRCPPGPIMALLASRPWFEHVGDLHYRFDDSEVEKQ